MGKKCVALDINGTWQAEIVTVCMNINYRSDPSIFISFQNDFF